MKIADLKVIFFLILFFSISLNLIQADSILQPQKIIFLKQEDFSSDSAEKQADRSVETQIIELTGSALDKLDEDVKIIYVKERNWISHKKLLNDINNSENLGKFFVLTGVTGILSVSLEKKEKRITIFLTYINLNENTKITESFDLFFPAIIEDFDNYFKFCLEKTEKNFPGIDIVELRNNKIKMRISSRKNPLYEILFSGGLGYYSRQSFKGNIYSLGFTSYANLDINVQNIGLSMYTEFSPLFNDPATNKNNDFFLYNVFASFDIGIWFLNKTFKIGVGAGVSPGTFYKADYDQNSGDNYIVKIYSVLLFPYLNISILPIRKIEIILNIGSFISLTDFNNIQPFYSFPIYLRLIFRYFIFKQLFFEISIPFYMIGFKSGSNGLEPSFQGMINIGMGWRFEFWKRKR